MPANTDSNQSRFRLRPKQKTFVENDAKWSFYVGGLGAGKALALDTPIPTPDGWTTMGALKLGDTVFDERGQPCHVTFATEVMHDHPCYEVEFSDGTVITADADHQWQTSTDKSRKRYQASPRTATVTTSHILQTLHERHAIENTAPVAYSARMLPVDPYTLGAWLGDGNTLTAHITTADVEILQHIRAVGYAVKLVPSGVNSGVAALYNIGEVAQVRCATTGRMLPNGSLRSTLRAMGLLGNKHIPDLYLRADTQQRLALLQGLMDTDGHIDKRGRCEFYSTVEKLADDVRELCASLGIKATKTSKVGRLNGVAHKTCYIIHFSTHLPVARLSRKRERIKSSIGPQSVKNGRRYIVAVRSVASVPVRCIQVDSPSHLYLASRSYVPTHNTYAGAVRALIYITRYPGSLGLIGAPTFTMLRDTTMRTFEELCPKALIKSFNKNEMKMFFVNGTEVLFRSMDDPDKCRGINLSWFWLDEAPFCGYYSWKVLKARAGRQDPKRFPTCGWCTGTPRGKDGFYVDFEKEPKKDHFLIRASTYENAVNLPDGYAEGLGYIGNFALQEIEGRFEAYEGLVYHFVAETGEESHLMPRNLAFRLPSGKILYDDIDEYGMGHGWKTLAEDEELPAHLIPVTIKRMIGGVDWGFTNPAVCLALAVDTDDRVYVLEEFYQRRASKELVLLPTIADMAEKYEFEAVYCDSADPSNIIDLRHKMDEREIACSVKPADKQIISGIHTVRTFLSMREDGMPGLVAHKDYCKNTIQEFGSYQYPTAEVKDRNPTELPIPQNDHGMDALRYALFTCMGVGRTAEIAGAGTHGPDGDPLNKAQAKLQEENDLIVVRGQNVANVFRNLDQFGIQREGLFKLY